MAIKKYGLHSEQQITEEQIHMVKAAAKCPAARDDDNPELTDEQLASLRKMQEKRSAGCRR